MSLCGRVVRAFLLLGIFASGLVRASEQAPFADMHIHFNWNQKDTISADEAVERLRSNDVAIALVAGWPSELALEMREAGGDWVIPIFSPYIKGLSRYDWWHDDEVLTRARKGLEKGLYYGIGEVHLNGGRPPNRDGRIFQGLLDLAREYRVPVLLHTEASSHKYFLPVCRNHPEIRFQWAHAGGYFGPDEVQPILDACPNVWVDLSARDPWHYGGFADEEGNLPKAWRTLLEDYPGRFMVGSDPIWPGYAIYHWDRPDTGWDHVGQLINYHRRWLQGLPPELAERIRLTNARQFLGLELQ